MKTIDVTGLGKDHIEYIENFIAIWKKQENKGKTGIPPRHDTNRRKVRPEDFETRDSKLKAPWNRALAYED